VKLDELAIRRRIPPGNPDQIFFVWTDRNHDHAVQPDAEVVDRQVDVVQRREHQADVQIVGGLGLHLRIAASDVAHVFGHQEHRIEDHLIRY